MSFIILNPHNKVVECSKGYMIYNFLNDTFLDVNEKNSTDLLKELIDNDWSLELPEKRFKYFEKSIQFFIENQICKYYNSLSKTKPIVITPNYIIEVDSRRLKKILPQRISEECLKYIDSISFVINDVESLSYLNGIQYPLLQSRDKFLSYNEIECVLSELENIPSLISFYSEWSEKRSLELLEFIIRKYNLRLNVYLRASEFKYFKARPILLNNAKFNFVIDTIEAIMNLKPELDVFKENSISYYYSSEKELIELSKVVGESFYKTLNIMPLFSNSSEIKKDHVLYNESDIRELEYKQRELEINSRINQYYFGKIWVTPNGDIYTNLFKEKRGNIIADKLSSIVFNELITPNAWLKTRNTIEPCKNCQYCDFCAPISDFEYYFGDYSLCEKKHSPKGI